MQSEDPIERLLSEYREAPLPAAPEIRDGVRREIECRRHRTFWSRVLPLLEWRELFGEPHLAASALVCALAVGVLPAAVWAKSHAERRLARQSIHFDVFTSRSASQLATLNEVTTTRGHN